MHDGEARTPGLQSKTGPEHSCTLQPASPMAAICRGFGVLLLASSAWAAGAADGPVWGRPAASDAPAEKKPAVPAPALLVVGGLAARSAVRAIARGPAPPLRAIIGQREEAELVKDAPPGPVGLVLRALTLAFIFSPPLLLSWLAYLIPAFRERVWYGLVASSLARAGTAFIKWGQWASCRPDVFPTSLCAALSRLHSQAPRHRFKYTERQVVAALGGKVYLIRFLEPLQPLYAGDPGCRGIGRQGIDPSTFHRTLSNPCIIPNFCPRCSPPTHPHTPPPCAPLARPAI
jgi:hypothetical protein